MASSHPPPPYVAVAPSTTAAEEAILSDVLASPVPQVDQTSRFEAEKLRYFLLYLLVVDYDASVQARLDSFTRAHYLQVAGNLQDFRRFQYSAEPEDRILLARYFEANVHTPARILGIPPQMVMDRLEVWRSSLSPMGYYVSSVQLVLREGGPLALVNKFRCDEDILIPSIVPPTDALRIPLLHQMRSIRALYFHHVTGTNDTISIQEGKPVHRRNCRFSATAYLDDYDRAREAGRDIASPLSPPYELGELVKTCLDRLKGHAGGLGWPKSKKDRPWHAQGADFDYLSPPEQAL